ncbi:MAG: MFS transporter [Gammaproteobacteria bacterium]|nr:MFS transporter [Gammaproteobacteria bacterium]
MAQLPGGLVGERFGARCVLTVLGVLWLLTSVLTGWLPGLVVTSSFGLLLTLFLIRLATGIVHAPIFPVQAGVIGTWFPKGQWGFPNALSSTGLALGAAATQPLVAWVMVSYGWRSAFYVFVPFGLVLFALWWRYATDDPAHHRAVGRAELAMINGRNLEAPRTSAIPGCLAQAAGQPRHLAARNRVFLDERGVLPVFHLVPALPGESAWLLAARRGQLAGRVAVADRYLRRGAGWVELRSPVRASRAASGLSHSGCLRHGGYGGVSARGAAGRQRLSRGCTAVVVFCGYTVHRGGILGGTDLYRAGACRLRNRDHEHRCQYRRYRCRPAGAVACADAGLGLGTDAGWRCGLCLAERAAVAVCPRR